MKDGFIYAYVVLFLTILLVIIFKCIIICLRNFKLYKI